MQIEIFKTIEKYDDYEISANGIIRHKTTGDILKAYLNYYGYYTLNLKKNGKWYPTNLIHRLIANAFIDNPENKPCVDHIDNNRANNNISNLSWATNQENSRNAKLSERNTSGVKGVSFYKPLNKWVAYIMIDGIKVHLGCYLTLEEAKQARIIKANSVFGAFTNSIELI